MERLLASPQYGEMGKALDGSDSMQRLVVMNLIIHWSILMSIEIIWIRAFNQDVPHDQFLGEHAGDLTEDPRFKSRFQFLMNPL